MCQSHTGRLTGFWFLLNRPKGWILMNEFNVILLLQFYFFLWRCDPTRVMASSFLRFLDHTQLRTTVGRTPLDEWSARRRNLYLTTHNTHNRQTSMAPVGFEPIISAGKSAADLHLRPRGHWDFYRFSYSILWFSMKSDYVPDEKRVHLLVMSTE